MKFNVAPNEDWLKIHRAALKTLPDAFQDPNTFFQFFVHPQTAFYELGPGEGYFWLSGIIPGWKASVHLVIWGKSFLGQAAIPTIRQVIKDVMSLYQLKRLDGWIPVTNILACNFAAKAGFTLEGIHKKYEKYQGVLTDVAVYALLKEEN